MSNPPTPRGVSRLLANAGFEEAKEGVHGAHSEGFHVMRSPMEHSVILVNWWPDSASTDFDRDQHNWALGDYANVLNEAGYTAEIRLDKASRPSHLIVTAGEDTP